MRGFLESSDPAGTVTHGKAGFQLPVHDYRDDLFAPFFSCDPERARALLPSDRLHPVMRPGKRSLMGTPSGAATW